MGYTLGSPHPTFPHSEIKIFFSVFLALNIIVNIKYDYFHYLSYSWKQKCSRDIGAHRDEVIKALTGKMSAREIM
jgi:hypothetical protein